MKKSVYFVIALIITIMMVGATKKAQSQDSVALFPVSITSGEKLQRLIILTSRKETFTNYDEITKKVIFKMTNCNGIVKLYFPTYNKKGELPSCDYSTAFYNQNSIWFTNNAPANIQKGFSKSENEQQEKIIDRAIKSLGLFPEEIKKAEWLEDIRTNNIKITFEADED